MFKTQKFITIKHAKIWISTLSSAENMVSMWQSCVFSTLQSGKSLPTFQSYVLPLLSGQCGGSQVPLQGLTKHESNKVKEKLVTGHMKHELKYG
jgi:hypothetical protein